MICSVWLTSEALLGAQLLMLLPASFYALEVPLLLTAAYIFFTVLVLFRVGVGDSGAQLVNAVRKVGAAQLPGTALALLATILDWGTGLVRAQISGYSVTVSLDALVSSIQLYCLFSLGGFVWILFALLNNQRRMRGFSLFLLTFAVALSHQFFMYLLLYWPGLWPWGTGSAGLGSLRIGPILLMSFTAAVVVAVGVQVFPGVVSRWLHRLRCGLLRSGPLFD